MQYQLRLKSGGMLAKKKICRLELFKSEEEKVVMKQLVMYKCLEFIKCIILGHSLVLSCTSLVYIASVCQRLSVMSVTSVFLSVVYLVLKHLEAFITLEPLHVLQILVKPPHFFLFSSVL